MENLLYHGNGNTLHDLPTFPPLQQLPYPLLFPTLLSPASYCLSLIHISQGIVR